MMDALWSRSLLINDMKAREVAIHFYLRDREGRMVEAFEQRRHVKSRCGPLDLKPSVSVCFPLTAQQVKGMHAVRRACPCSVHSWAASRKEIDEIRALDSSFDPFPLGTEDLLIGVFEFLSVRMRRALLRVNRSFHVAALKSDFADRVEYAARAENALQKVRSSTLRIDYISESGDWHLGLTLDFSMLDPPPTNERHTFFFLQGSVCVDVVDACSVACCRDGERRGVDAATTIARRASTGQLISNANFSSVAKAHAPALPVRSYVIPNDDHVLPRAAIRPDRRQSSVLEGELRQRRRDFVQEPHVGVQGRRLSRIACILS